MLYLECKLKHVDLASERQARCNLINKTKLERTKHAKIKESTYVNFKAHPLPFARCKLFNIYIMRGMMKIYFRSNMYISSILPKLT
jgi:hypothetical protein